jgi:hypothetical protein
MEFNPLGELAGGSSGSVQLIRNLLFVRQNCCSRPEA